MEAEEFSKLFGRKAAVAMKKKEDMATEKGKDGAAATMASAKQQTKILEQKRSQAVGILVQSLRVTIAVVESAVIQMDTAIIDVEALQSLYEVRATKEELDQLRRHVTSGKKAEEEPLDKPDQFLWDLAQIPHFQERISCFVFQTTFPDKLGEVAKKLDNLKMTIDALMKNSEIKKILGIILAFGNYMNGGNKQKGQADGFNLDILPKLKDVKTSDNASNLLQYIVLQYVTKYDKDALGTDKAKLPFPDPSDIKQATLVNFDDLGKEMIAVGRDLKQCKDRMEKVLDESDPDRVQPFKDIMVAFVTTATKDLMEQTENLTDSRDKFNDIVTAFQFSIGKGKTVEPTDFFGVWLPFVSDFKDSWKREQQKAAKKIEAEAREKVKEVLKSKKTEVLTTRTKEKGLKAKVNERLSRRGRVDRSLSLPNSEGGNGASGGGGGQDELASVLAKRKFSLDPAAESGNTTPASSTTDELTPEQSNTPSSSAASSPQAKIVIREKETDASDALTTTDIGNDATSVMIDPIMESCEFEEEDSKKESCEFVEGEESCEYVDEEPKQSCEFVEEEEKMSTDRRGYTSGWIAPIGGKTKIFADDDEYY